MNPRCAILLLRLTLGLIAVVLGGCTSNRSITRLAAVGPDSPSARTTVPSTPRWFIPAGDDRTFNASAGGWERPPPFGPRLNN